MFATEVPRTEVLDGYRDRGIDARRRVHHTRLEYGDHPDEWLWYVPADEAGAPLVVFVHGGDWRRLSADDGSMLAPAAHGAGYAFASVNHSLCPHGTLDLLVDQVRRAVDWLVSHDALDHDPDRVVVVGHSSGAHLAAMVAVHDPRPAGFVFVSGIFDLAPVVESRMNDHLGLSPADAARLSPLPLIGASSAECLVAWAATDPDELRRQSQAWTTTWSMVHWNPHAIAVEVPDRHHFDIVDDLFDQRTALGTAVFGVLRSISRTRMT